MKKKEILTIFVLTVLVTGLTWIMPSYRESCCEPPHKLILYGRGLPLPYYLYFTVWHSSNNKWDFLTMISDFLFWIIILTIGWCVMKGLISWYKKDNEKS